MRRFATIDSRLRLILGTVEMTYETFSANYNSLDFHTESMNHGIVVRGLEPFAYMAVQLLVLEVRKSELPLDLISCTIILELVRPS